MYNPYQSLAPTFVRTTFEFVEDTDKNNLKKGCKQIKTWSTDKAFNRYTGYVARNCMHGNGTYDWKHENKKFSYSGAFYINNIDGYGQFSYPDGSVHEGLMKQNMRYGPGVFTQCDGLHNVGFWKGKQLIRLLQRISNCVPHIASSVEAKLYLLRYRHLVRVQEDVPDPAEELLSEMQVDRRFLKHSMVLYLPSVRHRQSLFINQPFFHKIFYKAMGDPNMYIEVEYNEETSASQENLNEMNMVKKLVPVTHIVAWNNNKMQIHMLKHIFKHRMSENTVSFDVLSLLHCKRNLFRQEGRHESLCIELLSACKNGERKKVQEILASGNVNPNVADCSGNNGLMMAASQDAFLTIEVLLNAGADVNCFNDEGFTPVSLCLMRYLAVLYDVKDWEVAFLPPATKMEASYTDAGLNWRHKELLNEMRESKGVTDQRYIFGLGQKPEQQESKSKKAPKSKKAKAKPVKTVTPSVELEDNEALLESYEDCLECSTNLRIKIETGTYKLYKLSVIKKTISKLIRKGADPNLCDIPLPPLLVSIFTKDVDIVNMVLNTGANPNILDSSTGTELTPLHVVALHEPCNEMVLILNTLLEHNANANIMTEVESVDSMNGDLLYVGKMPLHVLTMHEDFTPENCEFLNKMATMLIKKGRADVNALFLGHTPLSWCIIKGNTELLRNLLETNRVDPNRVISEEVGVPLTVVLSEKLTAHIDMETRLNMCEVLLDYGADPLKNVQINEFEGNVMEFVASQFESKEKTPKKKKGKKDDDKKSDKLTQFISVLSSVAQSHITRHLRAKILNDLLDNIKNNVTPEISTTAAGAIPICPENIMDCLTLLARKTEIFAEDAIKLLEMFQSDDETESEVLDLVHQNLSIIPYKKVCSRRIRIRKTSKTTREREQPVMGKLSTEEIFPIRYPFPRLMSTADLTGQIILPPDTDNEREVDGDGILSFFHPKSYLKPRYEDLDDSSKNRSKAIAKMQQDLMRKQAHVIRRVSSHEVSGKRARQVLRKQENFQVIPEVDLDSSKYEVCFECGSKKDKMLIPCVICQSIKFCSEKCYKESVGKDTLHQCHTLSFTDIQQILEASARALLEQECSDLAPETGMQQDGKEVPEKEETVVLGTESRKEFNEEVSTTKLKKITSDENEKLFDGKKGKKKNQKEKEGLKETDITVQREGKQQDSKMSKLAGKTDKEMTKGKFVNGTVESSVKKREEENVPSDNKVMPYVALVLNFGADSETAFDRFPLPYVVLRDGCLYYRLYGSKPQLLENYSLL